MHLSQHAPSKAPSSEPATRPSASPAPSVDLGKETFARSERAHLMEERVEAPRTEGTHASGASAPTGFSQFKKYTDAALNLAFYGGWGGALIAYAENALHLGLGAAGIALGVYMCQRVLRSENK